MRFARFGGSTLEELKRLRACIKYLRKEVSEDLPIRHLEVFLYVYTRGEVSVLQMAAELDLPASAASRALSALSTEMKRSTRGLIPGGHGLLEKTRDVANQRLVLVTLTAKGKAVAEKLQAILEGLNNVKA